MSTRYFHPSASASSVASTLTDPFFSMLNSENQAAPSFRNYDELERAPTSRKLSGASSTIKLTTTEEKARENRRRSQSTSKSLFTKLFGRRGSTTKNIKENPAKNNEGCFVHKMIVPEPARSTKAITPRESKAALDSILSISIDVLTASPSRSKPAVSPRTSGTTRVDGSGHGLSASGCQDVGQSQTLKDPAAAQLPVMMFEVAPGHYVSLRGGEEETMRYISEKKSIATQDCICCEGTIHCIADAELLLCPFCRVAQPLFTGKEGCGLALGFCTQDYIQMTQTCPSKE
jgi:hypothetical protein